MKAEKQIQAAVAAHQAGNIEQARQLYRKALKYQPGHPDALHLLALIDYQSGRMESAVAGIRRAIAIHPEPWLYHFNLGRVLKDQGQLVDAALAYREALKRSPDNPQVMNNLGNLLLASGHTGESVGLFRALCARFPQDAVAWANLGNALSAAYQLEEAEAAYRQAIYLQPEKAEPWCNLGGLLQRQGRSLDSLECLEKAHQLNPDSSEILNRLGVARHSEQDPDGAESAFHQAIEMTPSCWEAWKNLGDLLSDRGNLDGARSAYQQAQRIVPNDALRVLEALLVPPMMSSTAAIEESRSELADAIDALSGQTLLVSDPRNQLGCSGRLFYLAYHGDNDRFLMTKAACLFARVAPSLNFVAPGATARRPFDGQRKIRLGWASAHFCSHTIGILFESLLRDIGKQQFEVAIVFAPGRFDAVSERIAQAADEYVRLSPVLTTAQQQVADLQLDALIYPDLGMDPFTYFLAFSRLAPLQCVAWGHPCTTGIPAVDVFFSSRHQEISGAQDRYSERLVCLENPLYSFSPDPLPPPSSKADFGYSADQHIYFCPQSLFKLHPDFDEILAGILRADAQGVVALPQERMPEWQATLERRWDISMPDVKGRIRFFPRYSRPDYLRLLSICDVMLDPRPFGGGLTTLDALSVGTPIVSWPGNSMQGRFVAACYTRMGLAEFLADSAADYIRRAIDLAVSPENRRRQKEKILAANALIFDHRPVLKELEAWLRSEMPG